MEKQLSSLGIVLTRKEIKSVKGGDKANKCAVACTRNSDCDSVCPSCEVGAWANQKFCFNG